MSADTPMMLQYRSIKSQHKDSILFYRLGDFYEMFDSDAREVSKLLNLTLTSRHGIPMCGIPYHAAGNYIPRLLNAGKKIAICEQTSLPQKGKNIVERKVVEVITPGTVIDENYLSGNKNNFIVSIGKKDKYISLVYLDLSTAEFGAVAIEYNEREGKIKKELYTLNPSELIIQESLLEEDTTIARIISEYPELLINRYPDWKYDQESSYERLKSQFGLINLKAFGILKDSPEILAAAVLLEYIEYSSNSILAHIQTIKIFSDDDYLGMDESTQKNLEITRNLHDNTENFTLINILNKTRTSMGARKFQKWLIRPLRSLKSITIRHSAIDVLYHNQSLLNSLQQELNSILDIERISSKIALDKANAKDLLALMKSLKQSISVYENLPEFKSISSKWVLDNKLIETLNVVIEIISKSICDDPSVLLSDGKMIRHGYNSDLDHLKEIKENSKSYLSKYLEEEKQNSGITNLKIKFNRIIGHYIEVTKANINMVPSHFIKRQSLVNNERYTTEKLSVIESELNSASEKIISLEKKLFLEIRDRIKKEIDSFLQISEYISDIDCISSFAQAATEYGYTKPVLTESSDLIIEEGRHPVVECNLGPGDFIPNQTILNNGENSFALITGPNMAGKSTYLRQVALIVLMAQAGSFVPASYAKIGLRDRIFCRVGASDNLARGESTFLVEMNETAFILRNATMKSLVIMDEVGRGTSTEDGLALAWAISEFLLNKEIKTLFATHYHELTRIDNKNLINLHLEVKETQGEIVFLKKVKPGSAGSSYGIHVAKLAGIPVSVLSRASSILDGLKTIKQDFITPSKENIIEYQPSLFNDHELIINSIKSLDINKTTPFDALLFLNNLKKEVEALD